jgi:glucose-6-phosphate isomerase
MPHPLNTLAAVGALKVQAAALESANIADMLSTDAQRVTDFSTSAAGLSLDYSKHLLNRDARQSLLELAAQAELPQAAADLLAGAIVNTTENRPALHSLLRASTAPAGLEDKFGEVDDTRKRMREIADALNSGKVLGYSGSIITDIVNIGIGGSDLGPRLVTEALKPFHGDLACHYVANVDPADLQNTLLELNPETTLFIVCSKSFRTEETLANSLAARDWMLTAGAGESDLEKHFLAVTTNLQAAADFGIPEGNCLPLWDWVGGRYSVWSAIGLSCAIAIGWQQFEQFLQGAEAMDQHFLSAAPEHNMPMLMSLLELWYCHFFAAGNHVVLPYDQALAKLPNFLQQLTMESNGKSVLTDGSALPYDSSPVLWGSAGTMGQHSFHQLLHQGTQLCPTDFILPLRTHTGMAEQHRMLVANCLAQSRTMLVGRSEEESRASLLARGIAADEAERLAPHLAMPGNRPNSTITMEALTPATLGALLALYEHRTYCSGHLWGINPFDQWGVELGKEIGVQVLECMNADAPGTTLDASTEQLLARWQDSQ